MSRSAGKLVTTYNSTYTPPKFMPGYTGHCPNIRDGFGDTYGNATQKYFHNLRSEVFNKSYSPLTRTGQFPTYYTNNPDSVIGARTRTRDRWLATPKYSLSNVDFEKKAKLTALMDLGQKHREHYLDKSGTTYRADNFNLPISAEDQIKQKCQFIILATRYGGDINPEPKL